MGWVRLLGAAGALAICTVGGSALAKKGDQPAPAASPSKPAPSKGNPDAAQIAYVEQIAAPADWLRNAGFWVEADSLIPPTLDRPLVNDAIVIATSGNSATQAQAGTDQLAVVVQWGRGNVAVQRQTGSGNCAEGVQISLGAGAAGANAGAGNGPEFDWFGFEVDPGHSGAHNNAPEPGASGSAPGEGNTLSQIQNGSANQARAVQIGWGNAAVQEQDGSGNGSTIVQIGHNNRAETDQDGQENASTIVQQGSGNSARVEQ